MDHIYKIVAYERWDEGECFFDCFWCVRWPLLSNGEFEQEEQVVASTDILTDRPPSKDDGALQDRTLEDLGFPEAAQMLRDLPKADMRARFNVTKRVIYDSDVPLTREQAEEMHLNRRKS